jgi:kynurenine formamidase
MEIGNLVDITRRLTPGGPTNTYGWKRRLELSRIVFPDQATQIAHDLTIMSHAGTHIETPSHMKLGEGMNIADYPADTFIGSAVLVEVTHRAPRGSVTAQDIENATEGNVRPGDILIIWGRYQPEERPRINLEAAEWIVAHGIKMLCFDSVDGIDDDAHDVILGNDVPLLEDIVNLHKVHRKRVFLIALPLPIEGLDSCPVRAVIIEEGVDAYNS